MTENVFRPSRRIDGKRVISRFYSGRYALRRGDRVVTVGLETTDERVARKRLRDLVVAKQREAEGIDPPAALRHAAGLPLVELVADYRADLVGQQLEPGHIRDTIGRITRMVRGAGWAYLQDVRPESFTRWRAGLSFSAKTKKEYQTSINAFLNWLVRMDRLLVNPLAKVDPIVTRGKSVRESRAYTRDEILDLCRHAPPHRRLVYLFLTYTGARKNEARSLLWDDISFGEKSFVTLRPVNTKSRKRRVVRLTPGLEALLREESVKQGAGTGRHVFPRFPSDDAFHADLQKAGIDRRNALGLVVHFHAFRKTFTTWFQSAGGSQRAAQEILGHSDPSLTANVYIDASSLSMQDEVVKIPWYDNALTDAHDPVRSSVSEGFRCFLNNLIAFAQKAASEAEAGFPAPPSLAARHGFEP